MEQKKGLVEIFCVDASKSMWYSQTFPFIFGNSKLETSRQLINHPVDTPEDCFDCHYTTLIKFSNLPEIVVDFAIHDEEQKTRIHNALDQIHHSSGTALFATLKFCEQKMVEFITHPTKNHMKWCALLHVYTDGEDNASDELRKREYLREKESLVDSHPNLKYHSFLYSFNSEFTQAKSYAESMGASLIMVETNGVNNTIESRNKLIFQNIKPSSSTITQTKSTPMVW
eukprot:TRINITY_DN369_c0_g1_i3.p1 TRINITY_DN369_c0_g1~~TRINITY_DN369_c0_g1_i3.p1  ORF type:complete len:228 (-),score=21.45 TRINITY_DN369_c0_g1_i3:67-750(-)